MRPALLLLLPAALLAVVGQPARAQAPPVAPPPSHPPVQLVYTRGPAASDCADERGLRQAILKELAYDPFQPTASLVLTVAIDRHAGELAAVIELRNEAGKLVWSDNGITTRSPCASLVKAMGLVIAMRLEAQPAAAVPAEAVPAEPAPPAPPAAPSSPEPAPTPAPPPVPVPAPPVAPVAPPAPRSGYALAAGVDAIFTPFFTPSFSAGVSPWVAFRPVGVPLSIEVGAHQAWSVVPARLTLTPYRSTYTSGVLQACWLPWGSLFLCPMVEVGVVSLAPVNEYGDTYAINPSARVAVGLGGTYERAIAEHFALRAFAQFEGIPLAWSFTKDDVIRWVPSRFSLAWGVGLAVRP